MKEEHLPFLPAELWEKILLNLDCDSWCNLAKSYDFINDVITSIKKKEVERCRKNLKLIPFEHFFELQEMSKEPKKTPKIKVLKSYVNEWKFHSIDKIKLKSLQYSDSEQVVDYINMSGRWIFLYTKPKSAGNGVMGFRMLHLDTMARYEYPMPHLYVEKFTFLSCEGASSCQNSTNGVGSCWCGKDLKHDQLQLHLPLNLRILQSGAVTHQVNLHPFQRPAITGTYCVTFDKFSLSFEADFEFDAESFKTKVRNPKPHTFVFEGTPSAPHKRRRLLDVSAFPEPNNTFRAVLHILDQAESKYKVLLIHGSRLLLETEVPCLVQCWLLRGNTLLGITSGGELVIVNHKGKFKDSRKLGYYTCACLCVNFLVLSTRTGQILIYRLNTKISHALLEINFRRPTKELRICTESITQIMFVPTASSPELLVLTALNKLYHIRL